MKIPRPLRGLLGSDGPAHPVPPAPATPAASAPAPTPPAPRLEPAVLAILETGAFDQEWYQAQTGLSFPSRQAAVKHYLAQGRARRFSPHPLFEPELTDPQWNKRDKDPLLHFLATGEFRAHPLFQDAEVGQQSDGEHQGQRWLRWIHAATPDTPVPGQPSTWGPMRSAMLAAAAEWRHDEEAAAGARWVDRVSLLPDPVPAEPETDLDLDDLEREPGDEDADADAVEETSDGTDEGSEVVEVEEPPALASIVVTATGSPDDLRTSLDSILAQHYPALEVIAVLAPGADAAGVDDLLGDDRLRVVRGDVPGTAALRALGLARATGRYVAFVDAGIRWFPFHLHHLVAALEQNGWELAHGVVKDAAASRYRSFPGGYDQLLHGNAIDLASLLASRDLLARVGLPDAAADLDYATVLRLARAASPHAVRALSLERPVTGDDQVPSLADRRVALGAILAEPAASVAGRVSLVVPARHFNRALTPMAALAGPDVEMIVVGIRTRVQRCLAAGALASWPVRFVGWSSTDNWSLLATLGIATATGEKLLLLRQGGALTRTVIGRLVAALDDPGVAVVQPLNRDPGDSIASFGAGFPGQVARRRVLTPFPLLQGYAASIVAPGSPRTVPAAWSEAVGVRRDHLLAIGGLDPALGNDYVETDLSLTLAERGYGTTVCLPDLRLTVRPGERFGFSQNLAASARALHGRHPDAPGGTVDLLADAGLEVTGWSASRLPGGGEDDPVQWSMLPRLAHREPTTVTEGLPALWWAIDTASPAGPVGDQWGDTHFAESLAAALRRIGQTVSVDRREARGRCTRPDDDVTLVMRGLHRVDPLPNQVSMLWLISHPDSVTRDELLDYDVVYAASVPWARRKSAEWGLEIGPMLQCTDPELFNPGRAEPDSGPRVAWVGKSRGIDRPVLRMAITAGARPVVYGTDWKRFIDPSLITAEYLDNDLVGEVYASAGVVLNDHWEDMQRDGFLANRLFDAVACGSRVISDPVEGIEELFGGSVRTVSGQADMDRLLAGSFDEWFADRETRLENAARVAAEHSFDARARTLVDAAARRIAAR